MQLIDNPRGNYRFLSGSAPYSSGVVAMPGYEIVHVTLSRPRPYRQGFDLIAQHLNAEGRPRQALCAIELRSPKPFTFAGFNTFNEGYQELLAGWELLVDGANPVARTNVAPAIAPPAEPSLYAFSYTAPLSVVLPVGGCGAAAGPTFVVAGAGDLKRGGLAAENVIRPGETSAAAMREKAVYVMEVMQERLNGLQVGWESVTAVDIYTVYPIQPFLTEAILAVMGPAAIHGVHWFYSRPPIADLAFEMDVRGVRRELLLA
jgi:hypothetical protein